mmetsp:Transcript_30370/g.66506  ORF Transcript_30370/g.66506 Transcript_30370/m.66506 type:complete len:255 (-) Transcript_30370:81-845(-)
MASSSTSSGNGQVSAEKQRFSVNSADTLAALDKDHTGGFSVADVERNIRDVRLLTRLAQGLSVCVVALILGSFACACVAVELAKDLHVQEGSMIDGRGIEVSASESYRMVRLEAPADARRLQSSNSTNTSQFQLNLTYFQEEAGKWFAGDSESTLVVQITPDEYRTVKLESCGNMSNPTVAYGICGGMCDGHYTWELFCAEGEAFCQGNVTITTAGSTVRRLTDRAVRDMAVEGDEPVTLDRSMIARRLSTKQC